MAKVTPERARELRDAAALEALFFWQLADRETAPATKARWQKKADAAAEEAIGWDAELNGDEEQRP